MDGGVVVVLFVLLGLLVLGHAALWAILAQVVQQQGRILLRLDDLAQTAHLNADHRVHKDLLPMAPAPAQPAGLAVGSRFGDFQLPDLTGRLVDLDAWRGRRTLIVHWSITCGFCDLIAPDLARLEPDLEKQGVQVVLASYGDADANRRLAQEQGLACSILLQPDTQPLAAFSQRGTPVAYVLDEAGCVAEPLVSGADAVLDLAHALAAPKSNARKRLPRERPLSESRIERNGLTAGVLAPSFTLPDIRGSTVTLESYRGRRVLLVFTDPGCEPCDALAPDLARLGREGTVSVLVIGRGDPQENRRKAERFEFTFPVVVQKRWEVSKAYGTFATPVGYLVDEDGVIVRDAAIGREAIVGLAAVGLGMGACKKEVGNGRAVR
jgi:peroxiredoxin